MEKTTVNPEDFKLIHEKECSDVERLKEIIDQLYNLGLQFSVTPYIDTNEITGRSYTRYRILIYAYNE